MSNVVNIRREDDEDPRVLFPGYAAIDHAGAALAVELLERLAEEPDLAESCDLDNWARRGQPHRNVLMEGFERARAISPEAENAFLAVLGDALAISMQGATPDSARYAEMLDRLTPQ